MISRFESRNGTVVDRLTGLAASDEQRAVADAAHAAVIAADDAFHIALVKRYKGRAGDMRYRTSELPTDLLTLSVAYQDAVEVWRATWAMPSGVTK